ncbi:MAG TPA: NADH-quinone oxidoreductase subunit C [bacterium]|nr:NADH-quinone oxidoreductase subunit C [bacterium]
MNQKEKEIASHLIDKFSKEVLDWCEPEKGDWYLFVPASKLVEILLYLKDTWEFCFDHLVNLSAFDAQEHIEIVYHLYSYRHKQRFTLKVRTSRLQGEVPTVSTVYPTADFQEREVYDLLGVAFAGHPHLTRIMLPEDWVGHPLLKDYEEGAEYGGIGTGRK